MPDASSKQKRGKDEGRPPLFGKKLVQVNLQVTDEQRDHIRVNGGAAYVRSLIERDMQKERDSK